MYAKQYPLKKVIKTLKNCCQPDRNTASFKPQYYSISCMNHVVQL